jgi:hypothetical protein
MLRIDPKLIRDTIAEAAKIFISGKDISARINSNHIVKSSRNKSGALIGSISSYDANFINPKMIVATAPKDNDEVANFIRDLIYNPRHPVKHIIALGNCLTYPNWHRRKENLPKQGKKESKKLKKDSFDYFLTHKKPKTYQMFEDSFDVTIKSDVSKGTYTILPNDQCLTEGVLHSKLFIDHSLVGGESTDSFEVDVTFITLTNNDDVIEILPEELPFYLKLAKQIQQNNAVIQCADGMSLSGHAALFFEVIRNFDEIFASKDPAVNAAALLDVLAEMRKERVALVKTVEQFEKAVLNAEMVHNYSLQLKELAMAPNNESLQMPKITRSRSEPTPLKMTNCVYRLFTPAPALLRSVSALLNDEVTHGKDIDSHGILFEYR